MAGERPESMSQAETAEYSWAGHVNDKGGFGGEGAAEDERRLRGARKSGEEDVGGDAAIGERDFGGGRSGECGGNAGNDFDGDAGFAKSAKLVGGAAKKKRITALEANDGAIAAGAIDKERVDVVLSEKFVAEAFADIERFGCGGNEGEDFCGDEGIVEDGIRGLQ